MDHRVDPPNRSTASAASASHCASSVMSVDRWAVDRPSGSISATDLARFAAVRAPSTARPPSRTTVEATRCPSPGPTPDTMTVFPASNIGASRPWKFI